MAKTTSAEDTTMTDTQLLETKRIPKYSRGHELASLTIRSPPFAYVHLELQTQTTSSPTATSNLDLLTIRSLITSGLTQFLGLSGSSISVDILKVEGNECWVRVPRGDLAVFVAAVGGWVDDGVGWRVRGKGNWLGALGGGKGKREVWGEVTG